MATRYLGRHKFVTDIPALANEGTCFNLEGDRFAPGSIGQVVEILNQSAGRTRVVVSVVRGRILSRQQQSRLAEQAEREEQGVIREERERIRSDEFQVPEGLDGGKSWMDYDPRPRSGEHSQIAGDDKCLEIDEWGTPDSGAKIMIKGGEGSESKPFEPPLVPKRKLSSGDRDFSPKKGGASGGLDIVGQVVGGVSPDRSRKISQKEYAAAMGMSIEEEGKVSGGRKSLIPDYKTMLPKNE